MAKKKIIGLLATFITVMALFVATPELTASANPWSNAGINSNSSIESTGFFEDLDNLVYIVIAVGGFWVIFWIVVAGMKLSGSSGNPQKRTEGLVALGFVAIGGFVIIKAYDIASWVASFGS